MRKSVFILFVILVTGCSSSKMMYEPSFDRAEGAFSAKEVATDKIEQSPSENSRKVMYNAQLTQEVDSLAPSKRQAMNITTAYKGFMTQSTNNSLTVRVPAIQLNNALNDFKKIGKTTYENVNGQDVTDDYYDIKIRLENAEKTRERYLELLKEAKDVSEILKVEKELERLNEKIERFKGKIKSYDQQIEYSLVTIYFQEKGKKVRPGPLGYIFVGVFKVVKWLFVWD